jgi:hypothetical protein
MELVQTRLDSESAKPICGKITLVDLAGSERIAISGSLSCPKLLKEAQVMVVTDSFDSKKKQGLLASDQGVIDFW